MRGLLISASEVPSERRSPSSANLAGRWRLHPRVALRPEPFGALAYHYDNRRLNFLRSQDLVNLVNGLHAHPTPRAAFDAQGLDPDRWPSFHQALVALAASDVLEPAETSNPTDKNEKAAP